MQRLDFDELNYRVPFYRNRKYLFISSIIFLSAVVIIGIVLVVVLTGSKDEINTNTTKDDYNDLNSTVTTLDPDTTFFQSIATEVSTLTDSSETSAGPNKPIGTTEEATEVTERVTSNTEEDLAPPTEPSENSRLKAEEDDNDDDNNEK